MLSKGDRRKNDSRNSSRAPAPRAARPSALCGIPSGCATGCVPHQAKHTGEPLHVALHPIEQRVQIDRRIQLRFCSEAACAVPAAFGKGQHCASVGIEPFGAFRRRESKAFAERSAKLAECCIVRVLSSVAAQPVIKRPVRMPEPIFLLQCRIGSGAQPCLILRMRKQFPHHL